MRKGPAVLASVFLACSGLTRGETWGHARPLHERIRAPAVNLTEFDLSGSGEQVQVWGRGVETPRVYPDEWLPALFERTLTFDAIELAGGRLEWIFTGPRGGFTVALTDESAALSQRFYDSFGYNPVTDGKVNAARHPEHTWQTATARYEGKLRAVTVRMDHQLGLSVELNGEARLHQICLMDITRHQLQIIGENARATGSVLSPAPASATVRLHPEDRHQSILGFGGIATPTAYRQLSEEAKRWWWELVAEYNLRIQREYPIGTRLNESADNWDDLGAATPHYYGDNFPNGEISDFDYIRTLRQLDGVVLFEFWGLPPWAMRTYVDERGRKHPDAADVARYADAVLGYCHTSQEKTGAPPDVIGIQNEKYQPTQIWHEMTLALRRSLDENGFADVRIHMSDSGTLADGIERARAFKSDDHAWNAVDYAATHMYDYQRYFTDPDGYDELLRTWRGLVKGKPFLSTELCINSPVYQSDSYRLALTMGQLYHKNLVLADATAICYCWTLLNVEQPSYGATRSLTVPDPTRGFAPAASSHQLRVFGAFSRRLPRGMIRIATDSDTKELLASAFLDAHDNLTVILLNRAVTPLHVLVHNARGLTAAEHVDPYLENAGRPAPPVDADGHVTLDIDPGAIITLSGATLGTLPVEFRVR